MNLLRRRTVIALPFVLGLASSLRAEETEMRAERIAGLLERAEALEPLRAVVVTHQGRVVAEHGYRSATPAQPTNIKSASKSVVSAMVGIAIDKGILEGTDQKIAPLLSADLPENPDPRIADITIGNLLSMQAGLGRTSGPHYGRWIASRNWVRSALAMAFEDDPGGRMLYSTGSTHLLSAILTRTSGRPMLDLAREWFSPLDGFAIGGWHKDPQGIYMGGNQMAMSTRSLALFGELYRRGGVTGEGKRILPAAWIEQSWQARTRSPFNGYSYGYGWYIYDIGGQSVRFAWGHGGQMAYVVPELELTVAMTSDDTQRSAANGYRDSLNGLLADIIEAVA
jgi:CubicO group peptidase (beta-lactamase class C family)